MRRTQVGQTLTHTPTIIFAMAGTLISKTRVKSRATVFLAGPETDQSEYPT
jgi:hypothetical protein